MSKAQLLEGATGGATKRSKMDLLTMLHFTGDSHRNRHSSQQGTNSLEKTTIPPCPIPRDDCTGCFKQCDADLNTVIVMTKQMKALVRPWALASMPLLMAARHSQTRTRSQVIRVLRDLPAEKMVGATLTQTTTPLHLASIHRAVPNQHTVVTVPPAAAPNPALRTLVRRRKARDLLDMGMAAFTLP